MKRTIILAAMVALAISAGVANAGSRYDRSPIRVAGLNPDSWGMPTTAGERDLKSRYAGVSSDYCVGAIMTQDVADSSFVHGLTRYWDKLVCFGYTYTTGNTLFAVFVDAKGKSAWIIYRLKNVSVSALQGG